MRPLLCLAAASLLSTPIAAPLAAQIAANPPEATTAAGKVAGTHQGAVDVFRGIPFAAPPLGQNRWRSPQPVAPWQGSNLFADRFARPSTYVGGFVAEGSVITGLSDRLMDKGQIAPVPLMIGMTSADAGITFAQDKDALFASFGAQGPALAHAYVVNFARSGNPNGKSLPTWHGYDRKSEALLQHTPDATAKASPDPWKVKLDLIEAFATSKP